MRRITLPLLLMSVFVFPGKNFAQDFIDLGKCKIRVTEIKEIKSFKSKKGKTVKPSRRNAKFMELKLEGESYAEGKSAWYPKMFGAMFLYRGVMKITPAIALGIKFKNRTTGNAEEHWFYDPEVSFTMGCKPGESFVHYVIVEIPKDVTDFTFQGPVMIQKLRVDSSKD